MSAEIIAMVSIAVTLMGFMGGLGAWALRRIDGRFEEVRDEFKEVREEFKRVRQEIREVRDDVKELAKEVADLNVRVARLEGPQRQLLIASR